MLHIGVLQFTIEIAWATSLKDKRSVVQGIKDKVRRKFNVSVAEVDDHDTHTFGTLAAVMAGSDIQYINSALGKLLAVLDDWRDASLTDHQLEILSPTDIDLGGGDDE